jgi:Cof subfamily protein (haloacid dehalogenase superfamily)
MSSAAAGKYRLIALDLDGTTLDPLGKVSPRTRHAIRSVLECGTYVCFATGRNYTESVAVLEAVGHRPHCVFVGGASVVDTARGVQVSRVTMHPDLARSLCGEFESLGHAVLALQDNFVTGLDYLVSADLPLDIASQRWMKVMNAAVQFRSDLQTADHINTLRVGVVTPSDQTDHIQSLLARKYTGRVVTHAIHLPNLGMHVTEVFDPQVSKWSGLLALAAPLGITPAQIIAIGDDVNDLPMLRNAGLGVAMGNAHPAAVAAAKVQIRPNSEDGLAHYLEQLIQEDRLARA